MATKKRAAGKKAAGSRKTGRTRTSKAKSKARSKAKSAAKAKTAAKRRSVAKRKTAAKRKTFARAKPVSRAKTPARKTAVGLEAALAPAAAATAQPGPADIVDIPPKSTFNHGLSSASESTMLRIFGVPGQKTDKCSQATGSFKARVMTASVGPFRVTGLDVAVSALKAALAEAQAALPSVVAQLKTDGMLCVRHKHNNPTEFSNHSWGTAIDLFFGRDVVPMGTPKCHRGLAQLAPFLNKHGFCWGAGFSEKSVDSMHFELAEEVVTRPAPVS